MKRFGIALLLATTPWIAMAQADVQDKERRQAKLVSRLYQATDGYAARCRNAPPDAAAEFEGALARFTEKNADLMALVARSPHYPAARARFAEHARVDSTLATPSQVAAACTSLASLMHALSDTPEGQASIREYEALLAP